VLTGSTRLSQEARDLAEVQSAKEELERQQLALNHRRTAIEARVEALRAEFKAEEEEFARVTANARSQIEKRASARADMASSRKSTSTNKESAR
jgi:circadian clock protein KaiC